MDNFFFIDKVMIENIWRDLPSSAKAVYPVISVHCNKEGTCFLSQKTIAFKSGVSEKTVREGVKNLVKAKLLSHHYFKPRENWTKKYIAN